MKKIVALFLILILFVSGCGTKSTDISSEIDNSTDLKEITTEEENNIEEIIKENGENTEFEIGTVKNGTYENQYLGIKCNLPDWKFSSREELVAETELASVITSEIIDNEAYLESFENAKNFSDMKAIHPNGITNMNIIVASLSEEEADVFHSNEYAFLYLMSKEAEKSFGQLGIEDVEIIQVEIDGISKYVLHYSGETLGVPMHMMQMIHTKHKHNATITITGFSKEECLSICDSIYFEKES